MLNRFLVHGSSPIWKPTAFSFFVRNSYLDIFLEFKRFVFRKILIFIYEVIFFKSYLYVFMLLIFRFESNFYLNFAGLHILKDSKDWAGIGSSEMVLLFVRPVAFL